MALQSQEYVTSVHVKGEHTHKLKLVSPGVKQDTVNMKWK